MFIPGETIQHRFYLPFVNGDISKVVISYRQDGRIILKKEVYQVYNVSGQSQSYFDVSLSQQESLLFQDDKEFFVQLNVILRSNARCASVEMRGSSGYQHIREVVNKNG